VKVEVFRTGTRNSRRSIVLSTTATFPVDPSGDFLVQLPVLVAFDSQVVILCPPSYVVMYSAILIACDTVLSTEWYGPAVLIWSRLKLM
jgi:hypothetical protein